MGKLKKFSQSHTLACTGEWSADYHQPPTSGTATKTVIWNEQVQFSDNYPKWKSRMANGQNVSTTMVGVSGHIRDRSSGYWQQFTSSNGYQTKGSGSLLHAFLVSPTSLPPCPSSVIEQASSLAEIAFSKHFTKNTSQWQTGVFLGELQEAASMLARPGKHLRSSIDELYHDLKRIVRSNSKRGGSRSARALKDAITGTYLEWKFGVSPFINDIDDAARAFRALASGRTFDIVRIKGVGEAESSSEASTSYRSGTPGFLGDSNWRVEEITSHHAHCTLRGAWRNDSATNGGQMPVPMIFSLGLKDVVPTAWELVPWSFFVDYFANIGDVLGAWSLRFVDFAWLNMTTRIVTKRVVTPPPSYFKGASFTAYLNCGDLRIESRSINRSPYANRWSPTPLVKIPGIGGRDQTKWLNIAALLAMQSPPK